MAKCGVRRALEGSGRAAPHRGQLRLKVPRVDTGSEGGCDPSMPLTLRAALAFALASTLASPALAQVEVAIDPAADQRAISPLIYGLNFPSDAQLAEGRVTVGRWGGNSVTRYNYLIDVGNTAADYYFENIPGCWGASSNWCASPPGDPKEQSGANAFLSGLAAKGVTALFTIPTLGWVAKGPPKYGHPFDCGCKSGGQDSYDPYDTACGNGQSGGQWIDCGPPTNTSTAADPGFMKAWVAYLVQKHGPSNGKRIYALDNEPALWSSTHHDIRKTKLGYDELWQRMRDYAVAILEADPTAEIAGPAEWGWPNYFCSDLDDVSQGCFASSPDRAAHGGVPLVEWLLDQAKQYEQQNGKRILHYLDLHYYPQGGNPPAVTRSLWDPSYTDPSWINDQIYLVPRMRDWVEQRYPGTKIAVSEYDFYHHGEAVGAVTYAEVLGIFGQEGLDMATAWSPPDPSEAAFAAYKLYRNYDGQGGMFESTSVRATVTGNGVRAYAATGQSRLTVALVHEQGGNVDVDVSLGSFVPGASARVFQHTGTGSAIDKLPDAAVQGGAVHLTLPGTSITMLVVDGSNPNQPDGGSSSSSSSGSVTSSSSSGGGTSSSSSGSGTSSSGATGGSGGSGGAVGNGAGGSAGGGGDADGGCGCRAAGAPTTSLAALSLLAAAAAWQRRRGRKRS
jgi:MYXO-CTERM domain-containing protein